MKKVYTVFLPVLFLLITACKKEHPVDPYSNKLIGGTWELYKIDAASYVNPPFINGNFTFKSGGQLEYVDINGNSFKGTWNVNYNEETGKQLLSISVLNINGDSRLTQFFFDDIEFTSTEYFTGYHYVFGLVYSFYFKR